MLLWSSQNSLSQSKVVKSSAIWFLIVPLFARVFENFDNQIILNISGHEHAIELQLPFNWQLLFFAALFFMLASIVYHWKSKNIVKRYPSFLDFKSEGNTRLQINQHFKDVVWNNTKSKINKNYIDITTAFLENYHSINSDDLAALKDNNSILLKALENLEDSKGKDSDAFYFVYNIANASNVGWRIASLCLYAVGFIFLIVIAVMNIVFVAKTI